MKTKQLQAQGRPMSSMMINEFMKTASPATRAAFEQHKQDLIKKLSSVQEGNEDALAGFLFAFAEVGNEIGRQYNVKH